MRIGVPHVALDCDRSTLLHGALPAPAMTLTPLAGWPERVRLEHKALGWRNACVDGAQDGGRPGSCEVKRLLVLPCEPARCDGCILTLS